jgi:glycosyltransferase involved in cell wall biosynthesis
VTQLLGDGIKLNLNYLDDDQIQYFLNAADVVVLPYKKLTNSGVLFLAMSFGKPVICSDQGSASEIIKDNFGILCKKGELAKALICIKEKI